MLPAQTQPPPSGSRTQFVFHVYVDPIFGDDDLAWAQNPGNPNDPTTPVQILWPRPGKPLDTRTDINAQDTNPAVTGYLQNAPYSFRTLSGRRGALHYVNMLFTEQFQGTFQTRLPWQHPSSSPGLRAVDHVVIHCLPGLYGPRNGSLLPTVPDSATLRRSSCWIGFHSGAV